MLADARLAARSAAKGAIFSLLASGPALRRRLDRVRRSGRPTILNLHRVGPDDGSTYRPLDPLLFDHLLHFLKRHFSLVTVGELSSDTPLPKMVLSFDDGYRDFLTHAAPILRRHGVRVNHNIVPACIESGLPPLNVMVQDFLGKAPARVAATLDIPGCPGRVSAAEAGRISHFIKMRNHEEQQRLRDALLSQMQRLGSFGATEMMTLDDIRSLPEHEWGAHSYGHESMEFETDDYLDRDVERCGRWFREHLGRPMTIYAFPNGSCRPGQEERVLSLGLEHVLLVGEQFDRPGARVHHRFTFDARSRAEARFKALGGFASL